jgi:RNA polymerase sigma-70 factor (ECF subfamily)
LAASAAAGDVAAFEELYRAHVGRVFALCLRMAGDPTEAEELTQEAFVRAWQKLASFRGDSAFATWLHRLTVNVVLGEWRARGRRQARLDSGRVTPFPAAGSESPSPDSALDLERAIATLPDRARQVFVLHDVEGFRHREIAELTGMAQGTSKAQLHRARRLLRKVLSS